MLSCEFQNPEDIESEDEEFDARSKCKIFYTKDVLNVLYVFIFKRRVLIFYTRDVLNVLYVFIFKRRVLIFYTGDVLNVLYVFIFKRRVFDILYRGCFECIACVYFQTTCFDLCLLPSFNDTSHLLVHHIQCLSFMPDNIKINLYID